METGEIINYLYTQYYLKDSTPERLVSSYWEYWENQAQVQVEHGNVDSLVAPAPLGSMQHKSLSSQGFLCLTIGTYLLKLSIRKEICQLFKPSISVAKRMGLAFTYDCFRQMCSLALIKKYMKESRKLNTVIIGDGYGFLASLIKEIYPGSRILLVDLGKILLFQSYYCGKAHPGRSHHLVRNSQELKLNDIEYDFLYCPAEHLNKVDNVSFDLAINIASMQEMNQQTTEEYFSYIRKHSKSDNLFYCCNREEKVMPGGEISKFSQYPWSVNDVHLVDELCP